MFSEWQISFTRWLSSEDRQPAQLADWLCGFSMPPLGEDEEPFVWVFRCLPESDAPNSFEQLISLAEATAQVLHNINVNDESEDGYILLYNGLMLAARIACPDQLYADLFRLFSHFLRAANDHQRDIPYPIRRALTEALITNQLDATLDRVWIDLIQDNPHPVLATNPNLAFAGIRLMCSDVTTRGEEPPIRSITSALTILAKKLESSGTDDFREEFRSYASSAVNTYPNWPNWSRALIEAADTNQWPIWAIECLPELFVDIEDEHEDAVATVWVWRYVHLSIDHALRPPIVRTFCAGQIVEIEANRELLQVIRIISRFMDKERLYHCDPSSRAMGAAILSGLEAIHLFLESHDVFSAWIDTDLLEQLRRTTTHLSDTQRNLFNLVVSKEEWQQEVALV